MGRIIHRVDVNVTIVRRSERAFSDIERQLEREIQQTFRNEAILIVIGTDVRRIRSTATDGGMEASQ